MPESYTLLALRECIASLTVHSCRLLHERVVIQHGMARRRSQGIGLEPAFIRIGLCPSSHRSQQLSCAHTTSRNVLEHAIQILEQKGILNTDRATKLRAELQQISNTIHETDRQKNEAEIRYALLQEQELIPGNQKHAALVTECHHIHELIERHEKTVGALRRIHAQLLQEIDTILPTQQD